MRQETINICQFDELSESAKERAREWYRSNGDCWNWQAEWWNSAQAFSRIAPIDIREADYDRRHVNCRYSGPELSGVRAWKWLNNNGWFNYEWDKLTGYCGDYSFGDSLKQYMSNPSRVPNLESVFYEMAQEWVNQAADDCEYSYSDESIDESIRINEYEFKESGECL